MIEHPGSPARTSSLVVPPVFDPSFTSPVILLLHGRTSDGATIIDYSNLEPAAERLDALLVAPDALGSNRAWTAADVGFLARVLDDLESQQCIDRNRVWLVGLSLGGFMSAKLTCDLAGRFAAVGAVAGFGFDARACAGTPVVPVVVFHGTGDRVIPYDGVPPAFTNFEPSRGSVRDIADWAAHNHCAPPPIDTELSPEVTRRTFNGCRAETVLYTINGGGHSWPGSDRVASQGTTTRAISATAVLEDLFARHVRGRTS